MPNSSSIRRRLLVLCMPWLRRILEWVWYRYPRSFDVSIVAIAFIVCLFIVFPLAATVALLVRAMRIG